MRAVKIILILGILSLVFCGGGFVGQATLEPKIEVEYKTKTVYYPVEVVKVKEVEIPQQLRQFNDLEELVAWLDGVNIWASDCDDFALELQGRALRDGYIISFEVIYPNEFNRLFSQKLKADTIHAINLVVIGNEVYYIDPQAKEIAFAIYLD